MKIAHIVCTFPPYSGGIGKSALDFSLMMASDGHQVEVYTPVYTVETSIEVSMQYKNIKIHRIKPLLRLGNGAFLPSIFFSLKKYDLIYLHYPFFGGAEVIWFFSLFNRKTKIILHYHMDVLGLSPLAKLLSIPSRLIEKSLLRRASLIVGASLEYIENSKIASFYKKNKNKFRESYFPVNIDKFYPKKEREKKNVKQILFVGGLDRAHYFKGLKVLIDSLLIIKERRDWNLVIVGRGDLRKEYIKKCLENGIGDRVKFLDSVSDENLANIYRESDFFILPSLNKGEAFGIVLLEAMASGLPVLASNLPGVRSVFGAEEGLLLKVGDSSDITRAIEEYLNDDELLSKMSISARKLAVDKFSYKEISTRLNKIIREIEIS